MARGALEVVDLDYVRRTLDEACSGEGGLGYPWYAENLSPLFARLYPVRPAVEVCPARGGTIAVKALADFGVQEVITGEPVTVHPAYLVEIPGEEPAWDGRHEVAKVLASVYLLAGFLPSPELLAALGRSTENTDLIAELAGRHVHVVFVDPDEAE